LNKSLSTKSLRAHNVDRQFVMHASRDPINDVNGSDNLISLLMDCQTAAARKKHHYQ